MSTVAPDERLAAYTRMDHGTVEDYALLRERAMPFRAATAERVIAHMEGLHHGIFQGYYFWDKVGKDPNTREQYRGHPAFEMTERFCGEYDQMAFDPDYDTLPMEHFRPMVERIFARPAWGEHAQSRWPLT